MKKPTNSFLLISMLFSSITCIAQYPGQQAEVIKIATKIPIKAYSFDLKDVRLLPGRFAENMEREGAWMLSLPVERLLHSFKVNAGMLTDSKQSPTKMPRPLGGWEALDMEVRGHSIGHLMSGLSLMYASTGKQVYKLKGDSLVAGLAEVQMVLNQGGYLSAYPQNYIDRNIAGTTVWAPWYTLHKIFAGLTDMYWLADNKQALEVVKKMASWAYQKISPLSADTLARMLQNEFGGMNDVFYNLYSVSGNAEHLRLAELFYHKAVLDPLATRKDKLNTLHANTILPKIVGEARAFELTGDEREKTIATYFWNTVIKSHTYAHGGNSDKEHFFEPGKISEHLTGNTSETCNTYNMLKITKHLFTWSADIKYADYYEQALYNHILGQQDPATGMVCYFTPMVPGAYKLYSTPDQSFWCCVGSSFESNSKYGEAIYYHDEEGVYVNLFIPSVLTWKDKNVIIRQDTKFPEDGTTTLTINTATAVSLPVYLRYPSWAATAKLRVNGLNVDIINKPGTYIILNRKWNNGDKIEITYAMNLRLVPANDNLNKAAIVYGPILLAGKMGTEGMISPAPFHNGEDPYQYYGYNYNIPSNINYTLTRNGRKLANYIKPVEGQPLTFKTVNAVKGGDVTLVPYYDLHRERYVVYWDLK